MDDPNEGVLVLTYNREHKTLHRYVFNISPTEQMTILQTIQPVVLQESVAFEREMGKKEATTESKPDDT